MMQATLLVVSALIAVSLAGPWAWTCEESTHSCVRVLEFNLTEPLDLLECKMICPMADGAKGAGLLWPIPSKSYSLSQSLVNFNFEMDMKLGSVSGPEQAQSMIREFFDNVFRDYLAVMRPESTSSQSEKGAQKSAAQIEIVFEVIVDVIIHEEYDFLTYDTDESYLLEVLGPSNNRQRVSIEATTFYGARHAMETLSQLITWNSRLSLFQMHATASIDDAPAYAHRGLSVDTARNFIPVETLKRLIEGMAANKMNVFHWHISDSQSFPLYLPSVPELTEYGAYFDDQVYTPDDVAELVNHASVRGIRIVPEIDMPMHAANGWQFGELQGLGRLALCVNLREPRCRGGVCGILNPVNPNLYQILEKVYTDIFAMIPGTSMIHIGSDEVKFDCWKISEEIQDWLEQQGLEGTDQDYFSLWVNFIQNVTEVINTASKGQKIKAVMWTSSLTRNENSLENVPVDDYIVQSWEHSYDENYADLVNKGYLIIASCSDKLYLDCGHGNWAADQQSVCDFNTWREIYEFDPRENYLNFSSSDPSRINQIVGGEVTLWSETMSPHTIEGRAWPRGSAFAERIWSSIPGMLWEDAEIRYVHHRERLAQRGLKVDVAQMYWCHQFENSCRCINDVC